MTEKVEYTEEGFKKVTKNFLFRIIEVEERNVMLQHADEILNGDINAIQFHPSAILVFEEEVNFVKDRINSSDMLAFLTFGDTFSKYNVKLEKKSPKKEVVVDKESSDEIDEDKPQSSDNVEENPISSTYLRSRGILYNKKYRTDAILLKTFILWKESNDNDEFKFIEKHTKCWEKLTYFDNHHDIIPMIVNEKSKGSIRSYFLHRFYIVKCEIDECILIEPVSQKLRDFRRDLLSKISDLDKDIFNDQFEKLYNDALDLKKEFSKSLILEKYNRTKARKVKMDIVRLIKNI